MSLNPFMGMGRGMVGGFVGRALGLGSQHPVVKGIIAFATIVALVLFIVREYYDIQAARGLAIQAEITAKTKDVEILRRNAMSPGEKFDSPEMLEFCKKYPTDYACPVTKP
jgi:hypothetical protein